MSGEIYNVRKIMLRGNEISKFDADVLSNYDDKKTVLSSYLVKQLIAKQAAKGVEFDNSIVSEQEMWQIKLTTSEEITEFSIFEQEEGVKMQPILLSAASGTVELPKANVELQGVILTHENYEVKNNSDWSFTEVSDFYSSVYPKQFGSSGEVSNLGLMVVDFSAMNLQQLSEIHVPKLIKIEVPNIHDSYDAHWFIPVAMKTPTISKDILIDAPSVLVFNPKEQASIPTPYYKFDDLEVSRDVSEAEAIDTYAKHEVVYDYTASNYILIDTTYSNATITGFTDYNTVKVDYTDSLHPIIKLTSSSGTAPDKDISEAQFTSGGTTYSLRIRSQEKFFYAIDGTVDSSFKVDVSRLTMDSKYFTDSSTEGITIPAGTTYVQSSPNGKILLKIVTGGDDIECSHCELVYLNGYDGPKNISTTDYVKLYEFADNTINVKIRASQFASYSAITSNCPTKLTVETVNHLSNPSAFIASYQNINLQCSYADHLPSNAITLAIPKYYVNVALEKLDALQLSYSTASDPEVKKMILNDEACIIVPKDAQISVDYTQMYNPCKFNILILEPSYLFKMQGALDNPVDRHRYLNMEEYLMDLPYRHYNNMLMDSLFTRSYENYDQTYKIVVSKNYPLGTFHYVDGATPLTVNDKTIDKYFLASKLVDEYQNVLTLDDTRLKVATAGDVKVNITDGTKGFDVYGTETTNKIEVEVPLLRLGDTTKYIDQTTPSSTEFKLLSAENVVLHVNNFKNDFNEETLTGDVEVNASGKITSVPVHITSTETSGGSPSDIKPIPAVVKIDEIAVGPELKKADVRDKMLEFENVDAPITLYTLGEAGWSSSGNYATKDTSDNLVKNIFTKVLVPKEGLTDFDTTEEAWKVAFAHMLRVVYTLPAQNDIDTALTSTDTNKIKDKVVLALDNATYTEALQDSTNFSSHFISGPGASVKLTKSGIDALTITDKGKQLAYLTMQNEIGKLHTGLTGLIEFY